MLFLITPKRYVPGYAVEPRTDEADAQEVEIEVVIEVIVRRRQTHYLQQQLVREQV